MTHRRTTKKKILITQRYVENTAKDEREPHITNGIARLLLSSAEKNTHPIISEGGVSSKKGCCKYYPSLRVSCFRLGYYTTKQNERGGIITSVSRSLLFKSASFQTLKVIYPGMR